MNVLEIEQLRKHLPQLKLDIATMKVAFGEFAVVLGGPKSGKGTLFKLMLDMLFPDFGSIRIFGLDSRQESEAIKEQLGLVARRPGLLYGASLRQLKDMVRPFYRDWHEETYRKYLRLFLLSENMIYGRIDNNLKKQFVLALALAHKPKLLLLDEPFLQLAPDTKERIAQTLWQEQQERGLSLLLATASPEEAARLGDTLHILHGGSLRISLHIGQLPEYAADLDWQKFAGRSKDKIMAQKISQTQALFAHYTQAEEGIA